MPDIQTLGVIIKRKTLLTNCRRNVYEVSMYHSYGMDWNSAMDMVLRTDGRTEADRDTGGSNGEFFFPVRLRQFACLSVVFLLQRILGAGYNLVRIKIIITKVARERVCESEIACFVSPRS